MVYFILQCFYSLPSNQWTNDWLITLNEKKCTVLHIGRKNPKYNYFINGSSLEKVDRQRDLGVIVTTNLKWDVHIVEIVKRANSIMYIIRKAFIYINKELFLKLYKTYLRPLLEYAFQVWSPYFKKDIHLIERVQRRATKMVPSLKLLTYEERLKELGLTTLQSRRERGDLIETYKILNNHYSVPDLSETLYTMNNNARLRGHSLKLQHGPSTSKPREHILPNRVVHTWNRLPDSVISAPSVNSFKNRLDKYLKRTDNH